MKTSSSTASFITFEGPDGSGKSTQARLVADELRRRGFAVTETREPGGSALGEQVRQLLLDPHGDPMTPLTMALLMCASRAQLVTEVIRPALERGDIVLCDRYGDSTLAYQAYGQGLDPSVARQLITLATGGLVPDRTIYVDITPAEGLARAAARGEQNLLDRASLDVHERVRAGYLLMVQQEPDRWVKVDGHGTREDVYHSIVDALEPVLVKGALAR